MTLEEISNFEKLQTQLRSLHSEISALIKKSSNDALNKFKLKFVNQTISKVNDLLGKKHMPFNNFEQFDENDLPTNSDVTLMLGQYLNCMEKLRADNIRFGDFYWHWLGNEGETDIRTAPPKKIKG